VLTGAGLIITVEICMFAYLVRRVVSALPLLVLITLVSFAVINAPPGDYMTTVINRLQSQGGLSREEALKIASQLRETYGLDKPFFLRYGKWVFGILHGDLGYSFQYRKPVSRIIWRRMGWTFLIALLCHMISVIGGVLIGIYSAVNQYSISDYIFTVFAFLGLSIPNFFLALALIYILVFWGGVSHVGGLFSPALAAEPWSWAKFVDLLKHIWVPVVAVGTAGIARNMRIMRGNLLDVLREPYIQTARAKGLRESMVIYKHAVANAIQPIIMYLGMTLPWLIQGTVVVGIVLSLPTAGPMFYNALISQDTYLAGSFLFLVAIALVIGNILADLLLAWIDPRVRYE